MSGFTALNVEPEDTFEEEIDDTREIQLEEAFKLYQNALKLHSQGPESFEDAREAYRELLQSEVFKYPEVVSDFTHDEVDDEGAAAAPQPDPGSISLLPSNAAQSSASSVPQLLYLAFKNRGQFVLDVARYKMSNEHDSRAERCRYYASACKESLRDFARALERDDTDLDLWKKAARVAEVLSTQRIARFCLESVIAGDDEDAGQAIDLSGLDEAYAAGELEEVVKLLQDDLSRLQSSNVRPKSQLLLALRETNDPYPYLPKRAKSLEYLNDGRRPLSAGVTRLDLQPASSDLPSLGLEILKSIAGIQDGSLTLSAATIVKAVLPDLGSLVHDVEMASASEDINGPVAGDGDNLTEPFQPLAGPGPQVVSPVEQDPHPDPHKAEPRAPDVQDAERTDSVPDEDTTGARRASTEQQEPAGATSRKRSSTLAGNEEPEGRTKSKRLRARESLAELAGQEEEAAHEDPQYFVDQLTVYDQADQAAFRIVNSLLSKLDIGIYPSTEIAKQAFWNGLYEPESGKNSLESQGDLKLLADLRVALLNWSDDKSQAIMLGHGNQDFGEKSTGMSVFLQHTKTISSTGFEPSTGSNESALRSVVGLINSEETNIYDAARYWLCSMLASSQDNEKPSKSSYLREKWPADLKQTVVQLGITAEPYILEFFNQRLAALVQVVRGPSGEPPPELASLFEVGETLFEMYLDVYSTITDPNSEAEQSTRVEHADRLKRWANVANEFVQLYLDHNSQRDLTDPLVLRFIWASTIYATLADGVEKSHVVLCLEDLKGLLERSNAAAVFLPNNAAMPVLSLSAIEQELSRLSTLDFFTDVFDRDNSDPVAVIEKLEPILESGPSGAENGSALTEQSEQLIKFLDSGDSTLKLFLWRRLQNAYTSISYVPKIVSCLLRAIETSVGELYTPRHFETEQNARQVSMLKSLRDIDELMTELLVFVLDEPTTAFECVDDAHLRSSMKAVAAIVKLLHGFVIYDDSVRVGQTAGPQIKGAASIKLYEKSKDRLKQLLVRTWTLQYALLKEAILQNPTLYGSPGEERAEYLSTVHHSLGIRHYCKHANKAFVKLVKSELSSLGTDGDYGADMAQVFFDLYQLRFASGIGDTDHDCPAETLDKKTAMSLVPTIMKYADGLNVKDLIKSDLKGTIDKMHRVIGEFKGPRALKYNRKAITTYLNSVITASALYKSVRGTFDLPTMTVTSESQVIARCGWFYLLGYLSLSKFKASKRPRENASNELKEAVGFFRQDVDHDMGNWESWYRLAQIHDLLVEEDLIYNVTKLNDSRRHEVLLNQRHAIHSYVMATSLAMSTDDDRAETAQKIEDMLAEFATRLYASSRPPLNMEVFKTNNQLRHLSSIIDQTMSKEPYHTPVGEYAIWEFAAYLFSRKFTEKPKPWTSHYMRAKCLWKMFQSHENRARVAPEDVIEPIIEAIDSLPKKEKSNEPILEPHFKLVSIVHKMVQRRAITHAQAQRYLQASRYAEGVHLSEDEDGVEWVPYVLEILKKLGHADKSNWHHRITDRAAHVIYDDDPRLAGALGAKHQFTQQIFTKTMTMQVWKPEHERAGRHFVYMSKYVSFFIHILEQLSDRVNLDQLARRVRRKTDGFLNHATIWEEVATTYVRVLRRTGQIPDGRERALFDGMNHEEFTKKSEMMEKWAHDPDTSSVYLDIMRDAIELKRLNNSLMKGPVIDDLIGDSYACLYEEFVSQLPPEEQPKPQPAPLPQGTFINMTTDLAGGAEDEAERARLNNVLRAQGDGTADGPLAVSISAPAGLGLQNSPGFAGVGSQLIPEVHRAPAKPGRTKTVTRREVQRKAESAIVKPPPIKTPILGKRPVIEIPSKAKLDLSSLDSPTDKRLAGAGDEDMDGSRVSSRRGSVQDSADGEANGEDDSGSELSDLDDLDEENKRPHAELETPRENAEDGPDDAGEDVAEGEGEESGDGDDGDGGEDGFENDQKSDQEDEEMLDAEDEIEVHPIRQNVEDTPGDDDVDDDEDDDAEEEEDEAEEEFHEAREEATTAE